MDAPIAAHRLGCGQKMIDLPVEGDRPWILLIQRHPDAGMWFDVTEEHLMRRGNVAGRGHFDRPLRGHVERLLRGIGRSGKPPPVADQYAHADGSIHGRGEAVDLAVPDAYVLLVRGWVTDVSVP